MPEYSTFYFTFSSSHKHSERYVSIFGTFESARYLMNKWYPNAMAYQYRNKEKVSHLTELPKKGF